MVNNLIMISQSRMPLKVFTGLRDFSFCLGKLKLEFCEHATKETQDLIFMLEFSLELTC